ncbi:MAG: DUF1593 domain-containing protein [Acidobacteria bacterium]|nr:DUF1593 domain-containing protein [Acidobacteriota bacterium]
MTAAALAQPPDRIFVSTDLGGDPDDIQSLYRLLHYSDALAIEGIISSPGPGAENNAGKIRRWIREVHLDALRANGHPELLSEAAALALVRQGSTEPGAPGPGRATEGSRLLVERARADDPAGLGRPLWVQAWGSLTDVAQALHDAPDIAARIRLYSIGSSNTVADPAARDWLYDFLSTRAPELWWIENGVLPRRSSDTFRGVYQGGRQDGEWGNQEFVRRNIRGHGPAGEAFPLATSPRGALKEGDSPAMLYLLSPRFGGVGNLDDPTQPSWGGRFQRPDAARLPHYFIDLAPGEPEKCQETVSRWRVDFLSHWKARWSWYDRP